jgi:hypothetical protein
MYVSPFYKLNQEYDCNGSFNDYLMYDFSDFATDQDIFSAFLLHREMEFSGTINDVLDDLVNANSEKRSIQLAKRTIGATRIIRANMSFYNQRDPRNIIKIDAILNSVEQAKKIYEEEEPIEKIIKEYRKSKFYKKIKKFNFEQEEDDASATYSTNNYSSLTYRNLILNYDSDILFVAIANGGVMPGLDIFLRYVNYTQKENCVFYPIKFSTSKNDDRIPRINEFEIDYLRHIAKGKEIILFDEDAFGGITISKAYEFLCQDVFEYKDVGIAINFDDSNKNNYFNSQLNCLGVSEFMSIFDFLESFKKINDQCLRKRIENNDFRNVLEEVRRSKEIQERIINFDLLKLACDKILEDQSRTNQIVETLLGGV